MKLGKRLLSFVLTASMLLGCMCTGVLAVDEDCGYEISKVQKYSEETHTIAEENVSTLNAGDIVVVTFAISNRTGAKISAGSYQAYLKYDSNIMSTYRDESDEDEVGPFANSFAYELQSSNLTVGDKDTNTVKLTGISTNGISLKKNTTTDIAQVAFKVKGDVESTTTVFSFDTTGTSNTNKLTDNQENVKTLDYSATYELTINGVPPTVKTVTLNPPTVTVNGTNKQTVQAKATSAKGTDLTNSVTWSIGTPENGGGVTIDENGTITVAANAKAGEYTVYANKRSSGGGGGSGSINRSQSAAARSEVQGSAQATLTVSRETSVAKELAISAEKSMVEIPTDEKTETATFTAAFRDQYGDKMTAAPSSVAWSIADAVEGVSISNGVVTVTKDAKNSITDSKEFTITATSGTLSRTSTLTVKRAEAQVAKIELGTVNDMTIPADGANAAEATVTATVKDQYDTPISNPTVEWSISPADKGVSIDTTGKITVTNEAKEYIKDITGQQFTVIAKSDDVTKTATVTVKRATPAATSMKVFKGEAELTGTTDTVIIPSGDMPNTYTYSAKVYDQYGSQMSSAQPTLSFATPDSNVTYNNGKVTVNKDAEKDKEYTLTVSYGSLQSVQIKITTKDIEITWPTATVAQEPVYGTAWKDIVTGLTGGSAQLNGQQVTGEFTLKNPNGIPDAGSQPYVVNFTGTLNGVQYNIDKTYAAVTIEKKPVTITGLTASDKEYDGNATATPFGTASISGKLDKDALTVVPGTASFTDKNVETNKDVTFTGYSLGGAAKDNYELSAQPATVKANITQKEITVSAGTLHFTKVYDSTTSASNPTGALVLNDVITGDVVSVKAGYTAVYEDANAASTKKVTLSGLTLDGTDAGNYKLKETTLEITGNSITKATCSNITVNSQAKYGTMGTLDLSSYLVTGATVGQITTTDSDNVLEGNPYVSDKTLSYQFKSNEALKDKTATITIPVTSNNYNNYSIIVTVTVLDKLPQNDFKFASDQQTKTYGDGKFTYAATGAVKGSTVTYQSSETAVATVDSQTGEVTILKAGTTTITASATATDDYAAAEKTYTLTVNKAKLTVQPKSYTIRVGETLPTPEVEYVGLKNNDKAEDVAKLEAGKKLDLEIKNKDKTGALENSNTTGTYEIAFKETPTFQSAENYDIVVVATGTLTINSRSSSNSGGGGVSGYAVSVTTPKNGKVSVKPTSAAKGTTVTVTVTPDSGYEMDKLTVTDASGKTISTTDKGNGKFTFTMPNGKVSVSATFKQTTVTPPSTGFVDVPASAYYADAVKWAVEKGITTGTSATTFSPEASCTRAQMVTFLWRAAGSPAPKATTTAFTDLDKSAYYYDAVLWAVEQGITTGTSATTFSPNATVTRGQTVTFLYRFAGQPAVSGSSSFTDVNSSDYYAAAVQWAKEQGITSGTTATTFSPTSDCTRGQIVTFLYRQLAK